jgi:hypothetical protein
MRATLEVKGLFGLLPKHTLPIFGHDQKIGSCLDTCQLFGLPMLHYQIYFIFLANIGQLMGKEWLNQNIG